jgi:hypothetical protein
MEVISNSKNDYMREYMSKKYHSDPVKSSQYRNSRRIKVKLGLSDEEFNKYRHFLADIIKIKEICERVPLNLVEELLMDLHKTPAATTD